MLATHPDVTGVCLDENPLPEKGPRTIYKDDLAPAGPGEAANEPGAAEGKVDPDVYRAFGLSDRVDVTVSLRTDSLPQLTDVPSEMWARSRLRRQAENELRDRVLSTVSADEFWVWTPLGPGMSGFINNHGLKKLCEHPDVLRINLPHVYRLGAEPSPVQR